MGGTPTLPSRTAHSPPANELAERCWVRIEWRHPRVRLPAGLPDRFRAVERVTTTAFGRWRYPITWPAL